MMRPFDVNMGVLAVLLATCCLAQAGNGSAGTVETGNRPNIILMMADDLGWGDTGFNGNQIIQTPHLDAMARAGLRFNRFYSAAPVCSPTRGSCLTGRHPYRYGVYSANVGHMRAQERTLAELLREQGYATGHFGKWHLGTLTKTGRDSNRGGPRGAQHYSTPRDNGFEVNFSTEAKVPTWDPLLRPKNITRRTWWDPLTDPSHAAPYGTAYWSNGERVTAELRGDDSQIIMDRVLPFIRRAVDGKKPFFAVIWFHAPHLPVVAGPRYTSIYAGVEKYQQHYFGCITALDEQVGRLRRELRSLEIADNTLVCFCSDNGPEGDEKAPGSAKHLRGRKRSLFEGGVRVPGLAEWPARIEAASTTDVPACTSDYLPTIVALLPAKPVPLQPLDGVSLIPLFEGKMEVRPRPIAFESAGQLALIDNHYKIVHQPDRGRRQAHSDGDAGIRDQRFMLFNLVADPSESNDLADEHPGVVERMVDTLAWWRESCRASLRGEDYR